MADSLTRLSAALDGRYRIERKLGEGGMATVYLADDLKHERRVAVKVLRPELAAVIGPQRFLAEIKTTASLQHPHILPLFDSGEADGFLFYVMPYIEGESIRDRLDREHQLPVAEAVQIARNVAEALDYAHRRGVIHRDIKPANILLQDGKPVLADFGIALAVGVAAGNRLTETGLSLGTPHYMSPEQATGDVRVGAPTDIYALSCVLYEMLVGEPPYTGSTPQAILSRIITAEPVSATSQRKSIPPNVDAAIRKALEKVPADRFTSANAFGSALADPEFRYGHGMAGATPARSAWWNPLSITLAATALVLAIVSIWSFAARPDPEPRVVARFNITPPESRRLALTGSVDIDISPDGSRMVYTGVGPDGGTQLWLRRIEDMDPVSIPGTEGAFSPSISPDGESVAFSASGAVRTISLRGGPPVAIAPGGSPRWADDGMIYFVRANMVHRIPATGGTPEQMTIPATNTRHDYPATLPAGRGLLYTVGIGPPAQSMIAVVGPGGGEGREILAGAMARYIPTGHILYTTATGALMAAPFDVRRLEVTGPSVALISNIAVAVTSASQFAVSSAGALVYTTGSSTANELVWVSRSGVVEPVDPAWTRPLGSPALSPDGTRVAVAIQGETTMDIWIKQLDRGPSQRLTFDGPRNDYPIWSPDGTSVAFTSNRAGPSFDLWSMRADGTANAVLEMDDERAMAEPMWSPDGQWFLGRTSTNEPGAGDVMIRRPGAGTTPVPLLATGFAEVGVAISPNGRWMAYSSGESGRFEVYVVPFPNVTEAKWPVSVGGGTEALWSRDGRELFYRNGRGEMVAVPVETEPRFSFGSPTVLFSARSYRGEYVRQQYAVSPDGQRFLMVRAAGGDAGGQLILVQNFSEELMARVRD